MFLLTLNSLFFLADCHAKVHSHMKDIFLLFKGQLISKWFLRSSISSKKRTNEFVFTTVRIVFVRFLEEIDDPKKSFRN